MGTKLKAKEDVNRLQQNNEREIIAKEAVNKISEKNELADRAVELLERLPEEEQERLISQYMKMEHYSGPIPHPDHLERYEKICKGSASRLIKMAEKQMEHRQQLESAVIKSGIANSKRGQILAFIIALVVIIGGFILIALNKDGKGIALILGALATLVGTFIYGRSSEVKERSEKKDDKKSSS